MNDFESSKRVTFVSLIKTSCRAQHIINQIKMKNLLKFIVGRLTVNIVRISVVICMLIACSAAVAQTTWTGAVDDDWSVAGNWTAGVPDATDIVTIPNVFPNPDPRILAGTVALGRSIIIEQSAELQIFEEASLTVVNNDDLPGILINGILGCSGTIIIATNNYGIENRGSIQITNTA